MTANDVPLTSISYGVAKSRGDRPYMEDAHVVRNHQALGLFCAEVYDGHGGTDAANLCAERLSSLFIAQCHERGGNKALEQCFSAEEVRRAYLTTDREIIEEGFEGGTAAATLYLWKDRFIAANVGDVRIVFGDWLWTTQVSLDHKPDLKEEKARIEGLGGHVLNYDQPRVEGTLAMSRALGDAYLKPFVTAEPRIVEGLLGRKTDVAILASDGIWDVITPKEAVSIARGAANPQVAAESVQTKAAQRKSRDNMTVVVLDLKGHTATLKRRRLQMTRVMDWAHPVSKRSGREGFC
jgi:protein phosphatase 1L